MTNESKETERRKIIVGIFERIFYVMREQKPNTNDKVGHLVTILQNQLSKFVAEDTIDEFWRSLDAEFNALD